MMINGSDVLPKDNIWKTMFKFTQRPKSVPVTTKVTIFFHKQTPRIVDQHMIDNLYKHAPNSTVITLSGLSYKTRCIAHNLFWPRIYLIKPKNPELVCNKQIFNSIIRALGIVWCRRWCHKKKWCHLSTFFPWHHFWLWHQNSPPWHNTSFCGTVVPFFFF